MNDQITFGGRLALICKFKKITQVELGARIGVTGSAISSIVKDKSVPRYNVIVGILDVFPNLNPNWLLKGEAPIWIEKAPKSKGLIDISQLEEKLKDLESRVDKIEKEE